MHIHPIIVAHDGCERAPPHTCASVQRGLDAGAGMAEVDVRATRDGVAILYHDAHIPTDHGGVTIDEVTSEELDRLADEGRFRFPYMGGRLTRLEEVLDLARAKGSFLNIDIKADQAIEPAAKRVREMHMIDDVVFSGCEFQRAVRLKEGDRGLQVLLNVSDEQYALASADYREFTREVLRSTKEAHCCGVNISYRACREPLIERAQGTYLPVSVWTVDDTEEMIRFLRWGVYSITTHRVADLKALTLRRGEL